MTNRTPFLTIRAEGALLPVDLLQRIVENDHDLGGLTPESYHLSGEKLNEASWRMGGVFGGTGEVARG